MNIKMYLVCHFLMILCTQVVSQNSLKYTPNYDLEYSPNRYVTHKTSDPIVIDGKMDESAWKDTPWTSYFVDIEGDQKPVPALKTRAKILWDKEYLYFAAELEEPHLWATYTERESIIFHENNFEIFIDPDSDTHYYYEYEVNALGTEWDLMMRKPYRDGGPYDTSWNIKGIRNAVKLNGTINNPKDIDKGWTIEIAMPWESLIGGKTPVGMPQDGDIWSLNFSRVEWDRTVDDSGKYVKVKGLNKKPKRENNWVWTPTGRINMHMPERWGFIQFSEKAPGKSIEFRSDKSEEYRWKLRQVYYKQSSYLRKHGYAAFKLEDLGLAQYHADGIKMETKNKWYRASLVSPDGFIWYIESDSRVWREKL